ncbi:MAG: regulatory iron-sulfur-containing complex subunit RicT [Planctomycetia bacterium]|jgi:cell fate regulator YaaT (PSP1 superfamily)
MAKYVVRYGSMRIHGIATAPEKYQLRHADEVIVRTDRGLEVGEVLTEATDAVRDQVENQEDLQILRPMTSDDRRDQVHIREQRDEQMATCQKCIEKLGLDMNLVDVEHIFGGERIIVYYLAEGRVDFRELVRTLAGEFQTRIEMRQIGVRDEAKLMADYGDCGKVVCCNNHLAKMPPVSMKMAKLQKATLDPTKISGRCGRLKCCLRFEYEVYEELQKQLPPVGARVMIEGEEEAARVLAREILADQLLVETSDRIRKLVDASKVTLVPRSGNQPPKPDEKNQTDEDDLLDIEEDQ